MKNLFLVLIVSAVCLGQENDPIVRPFLPEIVARFPNVRDLAISPAEDEIYFSAQSYLGELSAIVTSRNIDGVWTPPEVVSFSGKYFDLEPFLSPNLLRLYFVSNRPLDTAAVTTKDFDIWYVERKKRGDSWSIPKNIGAPINTPEDEFYPSVSSFNNFIFTRDGAGSKGKDDIFISQWNTGGYSLPVSISDSINTTGYEFNAFIAPDESYILYTCYNRSDGCGSGDLYISWKRKDNQWSAAQNIGKEINSAQMDYCPFVNTATGMLYFTSKRTSVKKQFDTPQNTASLLNEMDKYENGLSRLYAVRFSRLIGKPE